MHPPSVCAARNAFSHKGLFRAGIHSGTRMKKCCQSFGLTRQPAESYKFVIASPLIPLANLLFFVCVSVQLEALSPSCPILSWNLPAASTTSVMDKNVIGQNFAPATFYPV